VKDRDDDVGGRWRCSGVGGAGRRRCSSRDGGRERERESWGRETGKIERETGTRETLGLAGRRKRESVREGEIRLG